MIKYRYLRFIAAIGWGAVALIMVVCALWIFSALPVQYVLFYGMFAYFIAVGVILWNTENTEESEPTKKTSAKKTAQKPAKSRNVTQWKMYDMKEGHWNV